MNNFNLPLIFMMFLKAFLPEENIHRCADWELDDASTELRSPLSTAVVLYSLQLHSNPDAQFAGLNLKHLPVLWVPHLGNLSQVAREWAIQDSCSVFRWGRVTVKTWTWPFGYVCIANLTWLAPDISSQDSLMHARTLRRSFWVWICPIIPCRLDR